MSVGRFLLSLREGLNSERILSSPSPIKENINFWEENSDSDAEESLDSINDLFDEKADEIMEVVLERIMLEKLVKPNQAVSAKSSSIEAPATHVSKPSH